MKKIKSIKHLKTEKKRIQRQAEELEDKIRSTWKELKVHLHPAAVVSGSLHKIINNKTEEAINDENILKSTFTYGVSLLAKKFADKAEEKIDSMFKK